MLTVTGLPVVSKATVAKATVAVGGFKTMAFAGGIVLLIVSILALGLISLALYPSVPDVLDWI